MGNGASTVHAIGEEVGKGTKVITSSITPPNYFLTFVLPLLTVSLLGYLLGWDVYNESTGIKYNQPDQQCSNNVKRKCYDKYRGSSQTKRDLRDECYRENSKDCIQIEKKTSKNTVLLIYIFLPLVIGLIIASLVYQTALYIKNPKAAALITTTKLTRDAFRGGRRKYIRKLSKK